MFFDKFITEIGIVDGIYVVAFDENGSLVTTRKGAYKIYAYKERICNYSDEGSGCPYFKVVSKEGRQARLSYRGKLIVHNDPAWKVLELDSKILDSVNEILMTTNKKTDETYWVSLICQNNELYKNEYPNGYVPLDAEFIPYKMSTIKIKK